MVSDVLGGASFCLSAAHSHSPGEEGGWRWNWDSAHVASTELPSSPCLSCWALPYRPEIGSTSLSCLHPSPCPQCVTAYTGGPCACGHGWPTGADTSVHLHHPRRLVQTQGPPGQCSGCRSTLHRQSGVSFLSFAPAFKNVLG